MDNERRRTRALRKILSPEAGAGRSRQKQLTPEFVEAIQLSQIETPTEYILFRAPRGVQNFFERFLSPDSGYFKAKGLEPMLQRAIEREIVLERP